MKRGEVWLARLGPARGTEIGKTRPVLIVQEDALTVAGYPTIVVLPITTRLRQKPGPVRVTLAPRGNLKNLSQVITAEPRAIDRQRLLQGPLTRLLPNELSAVDQGLLTALGMHREARGN